MNVELPFKQELEASADSKSNSKDNQAIDRIEAEVLSPILCNHCQRTATNGIKCQGICVADSAY
jgi:hypothetical protein